MRKKNSLKKRLFLLVAISLFLLLSFYVYATFIKYPQSLDSNLPYWKARLYIGSPDLLFNDPYKKESTPDKAASKNIFQLPSREKKFQSKLIDLSLTIPPEYSFDTNKDKDRETLTAAKDGENNLLITISPAQNGCIGPVEAGNYNGRWTPPRLKIGGKYPIALSHNSISHGESGHTYEGLAPAENDYCIAVNLNINLLNETEFIRILEGQ